MNLELASKLNVLKIEDHSLCIPESGEDA